MAMESTDILSKKLGIIQSLLFIILIALCAICGTLYFPDSTGMMLSITVPTSDPMITLKQGESSPTIPDDVPQNVTVSITERQNVQIDSHDNSRRRRRTIYSRIRNITVGAHATTGWMGYRLGDIFKTHKSRQSHRGWKRHKKKWPQSIAVEYMRRIKDRFHGSDKDYDTLMQIINERIERNETLQSMLPDNHTLVIHLRTGDVIDLDTKPIREFLSFDNVTADLRKGRWYTRGLPFYGEIWSQIQREQIRIDSMLIITGWHFKIRHFRSIKYINAVIKYLEEMVDGVEIRINENPDEDVMIMSKSRYFVESGGGFSRMIAGLVRRNGGTVYGYTHSVSR